MCSCCFFFQAEDGIRDAQESRGLGDVYKRQELRAILDHAGAGLLVTDEHHATVAAALTSAGGLKSIPLASLSVNAPVVADQAVPQSVVLDQLPAPVSYTHLTLPTIYSV